MKVKTVLKTFTKSIRQYKKDSILSMIFVIFEVFMECLIPLFSNYLINEIDPAIIGAATPNYNMVWVYSVLLISMAILSLIFGVLSGRFCAIASAGFAANLREDLFKSINDFSFSNIDKFSSSSLVTRLTTDVANVQMAFMMIIRIAVRAPLMLVFSIVMGFVVAPSLAWIFLVVTPLLMIVLIIIMIIAMPTFTKLFKKYDALNESVEENISGIRTVKSYVKEEYEKNKFNTASNNLRKDFTHAERIVAWTNPVMNFSMFACAAVIIFVGTYIICHALDAGSTPPFSSASLSSLLVYGIQCLMSLMMLSMIVVMVAMSIESSRRIVEVLEEKSDIHSPEELTVTEGGVEKDAEGRLIIRTEDPIDYSDLDGYMATQIEKYNSEDHKEITKTIKTPVKDGSIDFVNVSFKYNATAHKNALENVNLHINSGEIIGILGGTGSSKTTLVNLISRLYDATEGEVLVGGKNVKEYDLTTLRDEVSVVLQKNLLFSGTIKDNLRWGNENATDEEIIKACQSACADEFIEQMPDKYDSMIAQGGANVSGGQKQRLCIARALLKKPKILILDDSTSAVDTRTDAKIRNAFSKEIPNTTKIIISQRISSVEHANHIIILENGRVIAFDTPANLYKTNDIYREIYDSQNKINGKKEGK